MYTSRPLYFNYSIGNRPCQVFDKDLFINGYQPLKRAAVGGYIKCVDACLSIIATSSLTDRG